MKKTIARNVFITLAAMLAVAAIASALFMPRGTAAYAAEGDTYTQNFASADKVNEEDRKSTRLNSSHAL